MESQSNEGDAVQEIAEGGTSVSSVENSAAANDDAPPDESGESEAGAVPGPEIVDDGDENLPLPHGVIAAQVDATDGPTKKPDQSFAGVEVIDGGGPPLPPDDMAAEESKNKQGASSLVAASIPGVELVDDGEEPDDHQNTVEKTGEAKIMGKPEQVPDEETGPLLPPGMSSPDDELVIEKKVAASGAAGAAVEGDNLQDEGTPVLQSEEEESGLEIERGEMDQDIIQQPHSDVQNDIESNAVGDVANVDDGRTTEERQTESSAFHVPVAWPVSPEEDASTLGEEDLRTVYTATPALPWWKQTRVRCLVCAVAVLVAALAISLGVLRSTSATSDAESNAQFQSAEPSLSVVPSLSAVPSSFPSGTPTSQPSSIPTNSPSSLPSSSVAPSSAPTMCVIQIMTAKRKVDLSTSLFNPTSLYNPVVAVDGRNMIVFGAELTSTPSSSSSYYSPPSVSYTAFALFYSLTSDGWEQVAIFRESGVGGMGARYEVAISERRAFVGIPYAQDGAVFTYHQDDLGVWKKSGVSITYSGLGFLFGNTNRLFGSALGLSGDLACIGNTEDIFIYRYDGSEWKRIFSFDSGFNDLRCAVEGDIIAIESWRDNVRGQFNLSLYRYDRDQDAVAQYQDPIYVVAEWPDTILHRGYLVHKEEGGLVKIYKRDGAREGFTLQQVLNITDLSYYTSRLAMDRDTLVVGGNDNTYAFSERDGGFWEAALEVSQVYSSYQLSGRNLVAKNAVGVDSYGRNGLYSFDLQNCTQLMPTSMPSSSLAPSSSLSTTKNPTTNAPSAPPSPMLPSTIQGILWVDEDLNGLHESSEPPLDGILVNLLDCDTDSSLSFAFSDANGEYRFLDVKEGSYYIEFFKPSGAEQYGFTIPNAKAADGSLPGSDVVYTEESSGKSECVEVSNGSEELINAGYALLDTPTLPPESPTLLTPATIQGFLWLDENRNGLRESSEPFLEGVLVNLLDCKTDSSLAFAFSDANGEYSFVGVEEGAYSIEFFRPQQYGFTIPKAGVGGDGSLPDSGVVNADERSGKSECEEVSDGSTMLIDAGYVV